MVSKTKLYTKLDALEAELLELIVPHLKQAVAIGNDRVFCVKQFNSFRQLKYKTDPITEELIEIGSVIISLREKLGEPTQGTIAERICWYCRQWSDSQNNHQVSGAGLAKKFLLEIEEQ